MTALANAVLQVPGAPERVLEIECGEGEGALFLAREYLGARVRGLDRSADAVRRSLSRTGLDPEGRIAFKQGKPRALPYPENHFDLVVQRSGRIHPGEVARVLRPGGHLIALGQVRSLLARRLRRRGIVPLRSGEADGEQFYIARLDI